MHRNRMIVATLLLTLAACGRDPSSTATNAGVPQSPDGRRTSIPGKAMDRAEDLKKEIADYNAKLDEAMDQGTDASPPKKPAVPPQP